jgi:hypothetical protein
LRRCNRKIGVKKDLHNILNKAWALQERQRQTNQAPQVEAKKTTQAPCSDQKHAEEASGVHRSNTLRQVKITFSAKVAKCFSASTIVILIKLGMGASACVQGVQSEDLPLQVKSCTTGTPPVNLGIWARSARGGSCCSSSASAS